MLKTRYHRVHVTEKEEKLLQMATELAEARASAGESRREVAAAEERIGERERRIEVLKVRRARRAARAREAGEGGSSAHTSTQRARPRVQLADGARHPWPLRGRRQRRA